MGIRRTLTRFFVACALALALVPVGPNRTTPAFAQAANCGGGSGNLCKQTTSCVWYVFGRICTTFYYYYPGNKGVELPEEPKLE